MDGDVRLMVLLHRVGSGSSMGLLLTDVVDGGASPCDSGGLVEEDT